MNKTPSYPFPPIQQGVNIHDIIYRPCRKGSGTPEPWARSVYERSIGEKARRWRLQYLTIEEELERAYRYVTPSADNANAHSFKFAEIIRSAAGAYERFCKTLHAEFYGDGHKLDIFNYLALKRFLKLAVRSAVPLLAAGDFPDHPEVTRPFVKLARWDMNSPIVSAHVPAWWDAYNSVKHDGISADKSATLANATASLAALFLVVEAVYGFGILSGGFWSVPSPMGTQFARHSLPTWARLFAPDVMPELDIGNVLTWG